MPLKIFWSNHSTSMDRFAFFIIIVASAALVHLILGLTVVSSQKVFLSVSFSLFLMTIFGLIICCVRRKPKSKGEDLMRFHLESSLKSDNVELTETNERRGRKKEAVLPLFSFSSVSAATNNFSPTNKLGEGGFGPVYKGVLLKGEEVAVKRLSGTSEQGFEELKNEATVIAKVQHKNLVRLLGCCIERNEKILIYEYMPNKSLDIFLFDQTKPKVLDWKTRIRIIEGIAQGLLYLHEYSRLRIIHRDLKASNILLDKEMNPKISDFGMARIMFGGNELQAKTKRIAGTYGYMSPEYAIGGVFSVKSDVFSFGVLLLEILSSKKSTGFYQTESLNLLSYAWDLWTTDRVLDLIDAVLLKEACSNHTISRYVNIALLCVQEIAEDRPTMSDVVSMLTNEVVPLLPPKQPAFSHLSNAVSSKSRPKSNSINEVTVSLLQAR